MFASGKDGGRLLSYVRVISYAEFNTDLGIIDRVAVVLREGDILGLLNQ